MVDEARTRSDGAWRRSRPASTGPRSRPRESATWSRTFSSYARRRTGSARRQKSRSLSVSGLSQSVERKRHPRRQAQDVLRRVDGAWKIARPHGRPRPERLLAKKLTFLHLTDGPGRAQALTRSQVQERRRQAQPARTAWSLPHRSSSLGSPPTPGRGRSEELVVRRLDDRRVWNGTTTR